MAAAEWQQANGAQKCENGRPKTVRNRQPKKSARTSEKLQNGRKQAKTDERVRKWSRCLLLTVFGHFPPFSGGHLDFSEVFSSNYHTSMLW